MNLEKTNNFTVKSLGVQEIDVYDIEVKDNHNFFANNICVHNSVYLTFSEIIPEEWSREKSLDFLMYVSDGFCQKVINKTMSDIDEDLNALVKGIVEADREVISSSAFWTAKKNYANDC